VAEPERVSLPPTGPSVMGTAMPNRPPGQPRADLHRLRLEQVRRSQWSILLLSLLDRALSVPLRFRWRAPRDPKDLSWKDLRIHRQAQGIHIARPTCMRSIYGPKSRSQKQPVAAPAALPTPAPTAGLLLVTAPTAAPPAAPMAPPPCARCWRADIPAHAVVATRATMRRNTNSRFIALSP
jgi:hypothetical protein